MNDDTRNMRSSQAVTRSRSDVSPQDKLSDVSSLLDTDTDAEPSDVVASDLEALRALVRDMPKCGTVFQSVAVAAVQILDRALCFEREAAEAALSLGQRERMQQMVSTAEEAAQILRDTLHRQGAKVMHLCGESTPPGPQNGQKWWFALNDALGVLDEGTGRMASLTTAQPEGSPAHELSSLIAQLLRAHHDALLVEADEWIS